MTPDPETMTIKNIKNIKIIFLSLGLTKVNPIIKKKKKKKRQTGKHNYNSSQT